jgi:flagellin
LAVQAGNDSNNAESRGAIKTEVAALTTELTRISESTNFNGTQLLDGTQAELSFQVGANGDASSQIKVNLAGANVTKVTDAIGADNVGVSFAKPATGATDLTFTVDGGTALTTGVTAGDLQGTSAESAAALNADAAFSAKFTAGVDEFDQISVRANDGVGTITSTIGSATTTNVSTIGGLDFSSAAGAAAAITALDRQISGISTARASLGADQNRFESVIKNLAVSKENLTAAGSRIRDTDMAEEMVKYTRANILSQAGTAMLAQANQSNSGVLQLLQ